MFKYIKGIDNVKSLEKVNIYMSDNKDTCSCLNGNFEARKPSQGLYIKNSNVLLLNMFEKLELGDKVYKVQNYCTNLQENNTAQNIDEVDAESYTIKYNFSDVKLKKSICFESGTDVLQIKYFVENNSDTKLDFYTFPYLTCRDFINMKKESMLKFNQRKMDKGVMVNLSVTSNINLIIKASDGKYIQEPQNICNIKHNYISENLKEVEVNEDVFKPGEFKFQVKKFETKEFNIFVSTKDFVVDELLEKDLFKLSEENRKKLVSNIEKEFVELRDLAIGMNYLNMDGKLISSLPYIKDSSVLKISKSGIRIDEIVNLVKEITEIVKSIEGQYLSLNHVKEAKVTLIKIRRLIKEVEALKLDDIYVLKEITLLKLWFVESVNRLYAKDTEINVFIPQIKEIIIETINSKNRELILEDLECVCLIYNALKIYENIVNTGVGEEIVAYNTYKRLEDLLENSFWVPEENVLKSNLNDPKAYANISMIYSISLSYSCIVGNMKMKILDTIFKELYTPYGLREVSPKSEKYNGNVYPKYMAHFLKANFRQNGVTRASQKLAYNLVKELLQDVSKYENGGIKKVYNEKGKNVDTAGYDIYTNSEVIRLYKMLI